MKRGHVCALTFAPQPRLPGIPDIKVSGGRGWKAGGGAQPRQTPITRTEHPNNDPPKPDPEHKHSGGLHFAPGSEAILWSLCQLRCCSTATAYTVHLAGNKLTYSVAAPDQGPRTVRFIAAATDQGPHASCSGSARLCSTQVSAVTQKLRYGGWPAGPPRRKTAAGPFANGTGKSRKKTCPRINAELKACRTLLWPRRRPAAGLGSHRTSRA